MKVEKRLIYLDNRKRKYVNKYFLKKKLVKFIITTLSCAVYLKQISAFWINDVSYQLASRSWIHNRCILTGRGYGVSTDLKTSRFASRVLINSGFVSGFSHYSW